MEQEEPREALGARAMRTRVQHLIWMTGAGIVPSARVNRRVPFDVEGAEIPGKIAEKPFDRRPARR